MSRLPSKPKVRSFFLRPRSPRTKGSRDAARVERDFEPTEDRLIWTPAWKERRGARSGDQTPLTDSAWLTASHPTIHLASIRIYPGTYRVRSRSLRRGEKPPACPPAPRSTRDPAGDAACDLPHAERPWNSWHGPSRPPRPFFRHLHRCNTRLPESREISHRLLKLKRRNSFHRFQICSIILRRLSVPIIYQRALCRTLRGVNFYYFEKKKGFRLSNLVWWEQNMITINSPFCLCMKVWWNKKRDERSVRKAVASPIKAVIIRANCGPRRLLGGVEDSVRKLRR